jgi:tRNA U34 5-carboxymethylaminomethyl modifying enzyme MnmG/GidA
MTNRELNALSQGFTAVENLQGVKFVYAITKTNALIQAELKVLQTVLDKVEGIKEYREEFKKINDKYSSDETKIRNDFEKRIILEGEVNTKMRLIAEKKAKEGEAIEKKFPKIKSAIDELWDKESTIKPHKIKQADLPAGITHKMLNGIIDMVED